MQSSLERLRQRREELGDEGGFTLIELLIVIVILGILAAIVVFAVQNLTSSSAKASCQSDYKTVETAVEAYYAQVGHYPNATDNSPIVGTTANSAAGTGIAALMTTQQGSNGGNVGPWLKDVPANGNNYSVWVSADGKGSIAAATGAPAAPGPVFGATQTQSDAGCPA